MKSFLERNIVSPHPRKYLWQRLIFFWFPHPFQNFGLKVVPPAERGGGGNTVWYFIFLAELLNWNKCTSNSIWFYYLGNSCLFLYFVFLMNRHNATSNVSLVGTNNLHTWLSVHSSCIPTYSNLWMGIFLV